MVRSLPVRLERKVTVDVGIWKAAFVARTDDASYAERDAEENTTVALVANAKADNHVSNAEMTGIDEGCNVPHNWHWAASCTVAKLTTGLSGRKKYSMVHEADSPNKVVLPVYALLAPLRSTIEANSGNRVPF